MRGLAKLTDHGGSGNNEVVEGRVLPTNFQCLLPHEVGTESPAKRMGGCFQLISKNNEVAGREVAQTSLEVQPHEV